MNIVTNSLFLIMFLFLTSCIKQKKEESKIDERKLYENYESIGFKFEGGTNTTGKVVLVTLVKEDTSIKAKVRCFWKYVKDLTKNKEIDTSFNIGKRKYISLAKSLELNNIDVKDPPSIMDGYNCTISYKKRGKMFSYTYTVPTLNTKERGLEAFEDICKRILKIGGLKPENILD